jgi:predicted nucleotidyltransferase
LSPISSRRARRLVAEFRPERIYLFGSRARDETTEDSDYDLMVVVNDADGAGYRLAQRAHALLWDLGAGADILVWTRKDFDSRLHLRASLPGTVVREGRLLFAA